MHGEAGCLYFQRHRSTLPPDKGGLRVEHTGGTVSLKLSGGVPISSIPVGWDPWVLDQLRIFLILTDNNMDNL